MVAVRQLTVVIGNPEMVAQELAGAGTPVGITTLAVDADGTDKVGYSLTDDAGGRFAIDGTTGVVTVKNGGLLDYKSATSHSVTVRATSTSWSGWSMLTIALTG